MPNIKSAKKQMRASARKHQRNRAALSMTRTSVRKSEDLVAAGKAKEAQTAVAATISSLDRAAGKGIIHSKNAARRKSRLMKKLNQIPAKKPAK